MVPLLVFGMGSSAVQTVPNSVVILNVSVVDVAVGRILPHQDVVLREGRIAQVTQARNASSYANATTIEGQGRFLIPGLWDAHIHLGTRRSLSLLLAMGVTGVRDMGGVDVDPPQGNFSAPFDSIRLWRAAIESGSLLGPQIVAAGQVLDGVPAWPGTVPVADSQRARLVVDSLANERVDFIKTSSGITRDVFLSIAGSAQRRGLPLVGHAPARVDALFAAEHGMRSVEHLTGISAMCGGSEHCNEQMRALARTRTRIVPTLVAWRNRLFAGDDTVRRGPASRYAPPLQLFKWDSLNSAQRALANRKASIGQLRQFMTWVSALSRAGVPLLAGTDASNAYTVPGFSVHDEMELLVQAGMSPLAGLQAATSSAASFIAAGTRGGLIRVGAPADLVILRENPLADIRRTRGIVAVIARGKVLDSAMLARMLDTLVYPAPGSRSVGGR